MENSRCALQRDSDLRDKAAGLIFGPALGSNTVKTLVASSYSCVGLVSWANKKQQRNGHSYALLKLSSARVYSVWRILPRKRYLGATCVIVCARVRAREGEREGGKMHNRALHALFSPRTVPRVSRERQF